MATLIPFPASKASRLAVRQGQRELQNWRSLDRWPASESVPYNPDEIADVLFLFNFVTACLRQASDFFGRVARPCRAKARAKGEIVMYGASLMVVALLAVYVAFAFLMS